MQRLFLQIVASFVLLFVAIQTLGAQSPNLQLTLRYNPFLTRYEVYALPDANQPNFNWGPAQISVVAPASVPDAPFNVTSVAGGAWQDNSIIFAPAAAPGSDFHGIGSLGAPTTFTSNVEKLVFHFTLPGGGCIEGLRLFINGVDPNSMAAGMGGGDFTNTIFAIVPGFPLGYEAYTGNYNNSGSSCNAPPVAMNDGVSTTEDLQLTFNPLVNDTDLDNNINPASVMVVAPSANGMVNINAVTGAITFTPNANYNGTTTFTYSVCDLGTPVYCDTATVTVTVTPVADAPEITQGPVTTPEDNPIVICPTVSDPDMGSVLTVSSCAVPTNGMVTSGPGNCVTFTPAANFAGTETICIQVCDQTGMCDTVQVPVTVTPMNNDAPIITQGPVTTPEDNPIVICPTVSDPDMGSVLTVSSCAVPTNGTVTSGPGNCVTFTPASNFAGTETICIQVCDQTGMCDTVQVPVTVTPVNNDAPIITQGPVTINEDNPIVICPTVSDPDMGSILTVSSCAVPTNGTVTSGPGNCVTFTPASNFAGTETICIQVCDQTGLCDTVQVPVTVTPVADAPVITQGPVTVNEDSPIVICPTVSDPDMGSVLTVSSCAVPTNGTVTSGPGNCVTFTPAANFAGTETICIQVCDQTGLCDTVQVPVTVTPVADAPVITQGPVTVNEDNPVVICPTVSDPDMGSVLTVSSCAVPTNGTVTSGPGNCVTFTPASNFAGTETICIQVCDQTGMCDTVQVPVTVTPVADAPVITQGPVTVNEDNPIVICPTVSDPDMGSVLTVSSCAVPTNGTVTSGPGNCVTFTPAANFVGTETICIQVCDQTGMCDTVQVPVTVTPVADAPVITQGPVTVNEDSPIVICPTVSDSDMGSILTVSSCAVPTNGTVTSGPGNCVTFTPASNFAGTETICIQVCDQTGLCDTVQVPVTVNPVADAPVITQGPVTVNEDSPIVICPTVSDSDMGSVLTVSSCAVPTNGTVTSGPGNCVTFTPAANFAGTETICIQVCDQTGLCDTVQVPVTVTPVNNDVPIITQGPVTVNEDNPIVICPTVSDPDMGSVLTVSSCAVPTNGTVTSGPGNCVTFTPAANFAGTETICIQVCDQTGLCDTVQVPVTVTPVADAPVITQGPVTVNEDNPIVICPTVNDPDMGSVLTVSSCAVPTNGTVTSGPGNCVTFTPIANFAGTETICIQVCDQTGMCDTVQVSVTVTPVADAPVITQGPVTTPEDNPVVICPTVSDPDMGSVLTVSTCAVPTNGTVTSGPGNCVTFTPAANFAGTETICIQVCDQTGLCDTVQVPVAVVFDPIAKLQLKVMLQGAMLSATDSLMRDDLRSGGYLPLTEPYSALGASNPRFAHVGVGGGETTTLSVLAANAGTRNAIVDWVFVELRSAADSSIVLQTRSALIQRDGDVVSPIDGVSPLTFNGIVGQQHFVAVKHRNHLGAMTASKVTMSNDLTVVDFINATNAQVYNRPGAINYDGMETVLISGKRALWAGNTNADKKVKYQGTASDNISVLTQVLGHPGNTFSTYNYNAALGYYSGDVNMDGKVKYQGPQNDVTFIFVNKVGLYLPLNTLGLYNYDLFIEQLP
jgi:hypothetical protein